jgi:hypothetical protein
MTIELETHFFASHEVLLSILTCAKLQLVVSVKED